jgi:hypothetical protein
MSIGTIEGFHLIESAASETDEEFRAAVEGILQEMHSKPQWWYPFKVGARFIRNGIVYREFECVAGSVSMHLQFRAKRDGGIQRAIIYRMERDGIHHAYEIRHGVETEFSPGELSAAA